MKPKYLLPLLIVLFLFAGIGTRLLAEPQNQQIYDLSWWTVDHGGGYSTNGDYKLFGSVGQPDTSILQEGEYHLSGGFLALDACHPIAVPEVNIQLQTDDVQLNWLPLPDISTFQVYQTDLPYDSEGNNATQITTPTFVDLGVIGNSQSQYYYVYSLTAGSCQSAQSNQVGMFTFGVVAGN